MSARFADTVTDIEDAHQLLDSDYEEWADNYLHAHIPYYKDIVKRVGDLTDGRILEVGAVPCHLTIHLEHAGHEVVGLDLDPNRFTPVIDRFNLTVHECDIERETFPIGDNAVDLVLFSEVLEHLRVNPIRTLEEIHRVLKPDGTLLLTTPNLFAIHNIFTVVTEGTVTDPYYEFSKVRDLGHMGHVREYTPIEVKRFLSGTEFNVLETEFANWTDRSARSRGVKGLGIVASRLFPILKRYQVVVAEPVQ